MRRLSLIVLAVLVGIGGAMTTTDAVAKVKKYELTRNNVQKPGGRGQHHRVPVRRPLGGTRKSKPWKCWSTKKISGVRAEQEGVFVLLWDQSNPTGAMAGVQILDGPRHADLHQQPVRAIRPGAFSGASSRPRARRKSGNCWVPKTSGTKTSWGPC